MKNNTNYFSHDGNAHEDMKCVELKMKHGLEGYGLYWELIERLFNEGGKQLLSKCQAIAYQVHIQTEVFDKIFLTMLEVGLIEKDEEYFWSKSLLKRIEIKDEIRRKRQNAGSKGGTSKIKQNQANAKQNPSNKSKVKESKVNEKKEEGEEKTSYGKYVVLKQEEYSNLCRDYGEEAVLNKIDDMNHYIVNNKGKGYKDYNLALRKRFRSDGITIPKTKQGWIDLFVKLKSKGESVSRYKETLGTRYDIYLKEAKHVLLSKTK